MSASSKRSKLILKIIGLALLITGLALVVIGFVDFFSSLGQLRGVPKLFWCLFVGFPVAAIGGFLTLMGFRREITSAVLEDALPIVEAVSKAAQGKEQTVCSCGTPNDTDSNYCKSCGAPLQK